MDALLKLPAGSSSGMGVVNLLYSMGNDTGIAIEKRIKVEAHF
jgi:hypothetical protein